MFQFIIFVCLRSALCSVTLVIACAVVLPAALISMATFTRGVSVDILFTTAKADRRSCLRSEPTNINANSESSPMNPASFPPCWEGRGLLGVACI